MSDSLRKKETLHECRGCLNNVSSNDILTVLEEMTRETIRTRTTILVHGIDNGFDLLVGGVVQEGSVLLVRDERWDNSKKLLIWSHPALGQESVVVFDRLFLDFILVGSDVAVLLLNVLDSQFFRRLATQAGKIL